jgi:hypothetical protein
MERIVHKAQSFEEADRYDVEQQINLTYTQRLDAAHLLKDRVYGKDAKDVRECHPKK